VTATLAIPALPVHRSQLSCGATLLVSPRPGAPVAAVQVHVRGGHSLDPEGREGTAYLAGRFVDQGTETHTEEEIAAALEPAGGALAGSSTGLVGHVAGADWKTLLELLVPCLTSPTYPREKIARQKKRVMDRLLVERDDPRTQGAWLFRRLVYGDHWVGRPDHGTLESVARIQRRHLVRHHERNWCGKRSVIAFCGDVDPEKVRRFLNRRLSGWNPGEDLPPVDRSFPERSPRADAFPAKRQQLHVFMGHLGVERRDPDYPALVVMDHVLGTGPGFTSRITRRLRDELGLAYTVHAAIHTSAGVLPGTFTAYIGTSPENLTTAVKGFQREIRRIQRELVSPEELDLAKSYLSGSFALGYERASRRVQAIVSAHRNALPDDHLQELVRSFGEVTAQDVRRVARAHLFPASSCLVVAGPVTRRGLAGLVSG
jgi:zinc protease